jgi:hypothetical protein
MQKGTGTLETLLVIDKSAVSLSCLFRVEGDASIYVCIIELEQIHRAAFDNEAGSFIQTNGP